MSTRNDYSDDEWNAITTAPAAVGLALVLGTANGSIGASRTPIAVNQAITRGTGIRAPELVRVLVERLRSGRGQPELPEVPEGNHRETTETLIAIVTLAVRAVETKSPAEVEAFKAWLASIAAKTLHAARGTNLSALDSARLSRAEQVAIPRLARVLAVARSPVGSPMRPPATAALLAGARPSLRIAQRRAAS